MATYLVLSGAMCRTVEASDPEEACAKAVRAEQDDDEPASPLGLVCEVYEVVDSDPWFCSTENACRAAGCFRDYTTEKPA